MATFPGKCCLLLPQSCYDNPLHQTWNYQQSICLSRELKSSFFFIPNKQSHIKTTVSVCGFKKFGVGQNWRQVSVCANFIDIILFYFIHYYTDRFSCCEFQVRLQQPAERGLQSLALGSADVKWPNVWMKTGGCVYYRRHSSPSSAIQTEKETLWGELWKVFDLREPSRVPTFWFIYICIF